MKFFLDTANLDEIRKAAALGLADGVTTNPSLIAKEGNVDFKQHIGEICKIVSGPVSAEVTSPNKDDMPSMVWRRPKFSTKKESR